MLPVNALPSGYYAGPLFTLTCLLVSVASSSFLGVNIGETSCKYRLDYSPNGRAFGIWAVIYTGCVVVCVLEMTGTVPVANMKAFPSWEYLYAAFVCALGAAGGAAAAWA